MALSVVCTVEFVCVSLCVCGISCECVNRWWNLVRLVSDGGHVGLVVVVVALFLSL